MEREPAAAAMVPKPLRRPPAIPHQKRHRSHNNRSSKEISSLRKENIAIRAALKLFLTKSTTLFRAWVEEKKNAVPGGSGLVDVNLQSQNYGFSQNYGHSQNYGFNQNYSDYASQSTQGYFTSSVPASKTNTAVLENIIKDLDAIGLVLDGTGQEAEKAGRRQVDSSSSQTSFESEPIVRRMFFKPQILDEILILSSDEEYDGDHNAKPSGTSKNATTKKKSGPKPKNSQADQNMAKVKKPFVPKSSRDRVKSEPGTNPQPLDLSQRPTQDFQPTPLANVTNKIPAINPAGNAKNVGRQPHRKPCDKCGKILNVGSLPKHSASPHTFKCKRAGCAKSFTSAKGLWDHESTHGTASINEHFTKV